jgi:hypothetical protein
MACANLTSEKFRESATLDLAIVIAVFAVGLLTVPFVNPALQRA